MHLWSLVVMCAHKAFHECRAPFLVNHVTKAEIAHFGNWELLLFIILTVLYSWLFCFSLNENVGDLNVSVDNSLLVDVPDGVQNVLGPNLNLLFLNLLVVNINFLLQIVGSETSILHVKAESLRILSVVEALYNIWVIHLHVDCAFSSGKLKGKV